MHQEPDRVPMHINASKWVVEKLYDATNTNSQRGLLENLQIDVYDMRGIDLHHGTAPNYIGPQHLILEKGDSWGGNIMALWRIKEIEKDTPHGKVLETEFPPLQRYYMGKSWDRYPWPDPAWFDFSDLPVRLENWQGYSIMASGASVFQHASYLVGLDVQLVDMLMRPKRSDYLFDRLFNFYFEYYSRMFEVAGHMIDVFAIADDFGTQNSLLIRPELFDQYFSKRIKKLADLAHKHDIFFLLHSCGNVEPLIPKFIELGVDILDPIQPESMDPIRIKKEYGSEICLRGGISSQQVLAHGSTEDVEEEVKRKLDGLMPGGGYIFSPGHPVLQVDIPVENIVTMYKTAYHYGKY